MPRRGGKRRKTRTHKIDVPQGVDVEEDKVPKSFVFKCGKVSHYVDELIKELRLQVGPHTAMKLRERKKNTMRDYLAVAGPLGVTHFIALSQTDAGVNFRLARVPQGPTLSFKVEKYCLCRHVRSQQRRPYNAEFALKTPPLVVLNNFSDVKEPHLKAMRVLFQNMFPALNVQTIKLSDCRRVVLFHLNKEEQLVDVRHFAISAAPTGISRSIKRVVQARIPNLHKLQDMSEFLEGGGMGAASDSEAEDEASHVVLPQNYVGRGNQQSQKSAIRLTELGPRLTLRLFKVERGLCEGDIMYHSHFKKTPEEAAAQKKRIEEAQALKKRRREEQDDNVSRKKAALVEKLKERAEKRKAKMTKRIEQATQDTNAAEN